MRRALTLTLCCLALSACGGDGDDNAATSSGFKRNIEPQAQERAEALLLTLSDFPDGWRAGTPEEDGPEGDEAFHDCLGVDYSPYTINGDSQSDDFTIGEAAEASSEAEVFETEEMAAAAVDQLTQALSREGAAACMNDALAEFEDDEVEIAAAKVRELSFKPPPGADSASAWQMALTAEGKSGTQAAGISITVYLDLIQLREAEMTAEVMTVDILNPFDPELRDALVAAVAERMVKSKPSEST